MNGVVLSLGSSYAIDPVLSRRRSKEKNMQLLDMSDASPA